MVELEHEFHLYPDDWWLADEVLKRNGFPTSIEQSSIRTSLRRKACYAFVAGNKESLLECDAMSNGYERPNPIRDLEVLSSDGMNVTDELAKVKASYNELFLKLQKASPKYMDLTWQIFRKFGVVREIHYLYSQNIDRIINPDFVSDEEKAEMRKKLILPAPTTDNERVAHLSWSHELPRDAAETVEKNPSRYRFVEFDADYFYGTGRFAFAHTDGEKKGDIFQTIWDVRQEQAPFFEFGKK